MRLGPPIRLIPAALVVAWSWAWAGAASAGPPFITDDPLPTDHGHWEIYNFVQGAQVPGGAAGEGGLDLNYGAARDLQLTLVIPAAWQTGEAARAGMGTVEIAAKYQFLHQRDGTLTPDLAIFPRAFAPSASNDFGSNRWGLLLPLWAQMDFGKWQVFGGGGYQLNPGPGARDFWTGGLVVQHPVTERLSLGAEIYHHTRDAADGRPYTGVNLGVTYKLIEHWSLLAAGGPGVQNAADGGRYDVYLALKADY